MAGKRTGQQRRPRPPRAAKAAPKPRFRPKAAARRPPHLERREIGYVIQVIRTLLFCPSQAMFSILMGSVLDRLQHVHGEASWVAYFKRQYLCQAAGPGGMLSAVWWAGVLSKIQPGYPPSQQCAEQLNTKVKRDMETLPRETHAQVCQSLEKVIGTWSATWLTSDSSTKTADSSTNASTTKVRQPRFDN